jgi:hypothetical protein|tara:strand:- start:51 stop:569 length:519 start_codon:yes stop_codon:yes gene_type:complete
MAKTTFAGPVYSKSGFITTGPANTVSLTADTTLSVATHAGKILLTNDADGKFTLPTINVSSNSSVAGSPDYNNPNNIGASFYFYVETAATDMDILTDGTDRFVGAVNIGVTNGDFKAFFPGGSDDVITMNGGTKGGIAGSVIQITAVDDDAYLVHNSLLKGSSTIATPFATS